MMSSEFKKYRRSNIAEMRPYVHGDQAIHVISISEEDLKLPTLVGGMVARNPDNHADQWYVAKAYFDKNFEPLMDITDLGSAIEETKQALRCRGEP